MLRTSILAALCFAPTTDATQGGTITVPAGTEGPAIPPGQTQEISPQQQRAIDAKKAARVIGGGFGKGRDFADDKIVRQVSTMLFQSVAGDLKPAPMSENKSLNDDFRTAVRETLARREELVRDLVDRVNATFDALGNLTEAGDAVTLPGSQVRALSMAKAYVGHKDSKAEIEGLMYFAATGKVA